MSFLPATGADLQQDALSGRSCDGSHLSRGDDRGRIDAGRDAGQRGGEGGDGGAGEDPRRGREVSERQG